MRLGSRHMEGGKRFERFVKILRITSPMEKRDHFSMSKDMTVVMLFLYSSKYVSLLFCVACKTFLSVE